MRLQSCETWRRKSSVTCGHMTPRLRRDCVNISVGIEDQQFCSWKSSYDRNLTISRFCIHDLNQTARRTESAARVLNSSHPDEEEQTFCCLLTADDCQCSFCNQLWVTGWPKGPNKVLFWWKKLVMMWFCQHAVATGLKVNLRLQIQSGLSHLSQV